MPDTRFLILTDYYNRQVVVNPDNVSYFEPGLQKIGAYGATFIHMKDATILSIREDPPTIIRMLSESGVTIVAKSSENRALTKRNEQQRFELYDLNLFQHEQHLNRHALKAMERL